MARSVRAITLEQRASVVAIFAQFVRLHKVVGFTGPGPAVGVFLLFGDTRLAVDLGLEITISRTNMNLEKRALPKGPKL